MNYALAQVYFYFLLYILFKFGVEYFIFLNNNNIWFAMDYYLYKIINKIMYICMCGFVYVNKIFIYFNYGMFQRYKMWK